MYAIRSYYAQFLRRRAELLLRLGRAAEAKAAMAKAWALAPRMPGLKNLARKLSSGMAKPTSLE